MKTSENQKEMTREGSGKPLLRLKKRRWRNVPCVPERGHQTDPESDPFLPALCTPVTCHLGCFGRLQAHSAVPAPPAGHSLGRRQETALTNVNHVIDLRNTLSKSPPSIKFKILVMANKAPKICHLPSSVASFPTNPGLPQPFPPHQPPSSDTSALPLALRLRASLQALPQRCPQHAPSLTEAFPGSQRGLLGNQLVIREQPPHHCHQAQLSYSSIFQLLNIFIPAPILLFGLCSH